MLKRLILLAFLSKSQAIPTESNSFTDSWGCAKCLRNEFTYIIPGVNIRGQVSDSSKYSGSCCLSSTDSTFCAKHFINGVIVRDSIVLEYEAGKNSLEVLTA